MFNDSRFSILVGNSAKSLSDFQEIAGYLAILKLFEWGSASNRSDSTNFFAVIRKLFFNFEGIDFSIYEYQQDRG